MVVNKVLHERCILVRSLLPAMTRSSIVKSRQQISVPTPSCYSAKKVASLLEKLPQEKASR